MRDVVYLKLFSSSKVCKIAETIYVFLLEVLGKRKCLNVICLKVPENLMLLVNLVLCIIEQSKATFKRSVAHFNR